VREHVARDEPHEQFASDCSRAAASDGAAVAAFDAAELAFTHLSSMVNAQIELLELFSTIKTASHVAACGNHARDSLVKAVLVDCFAVVAFIGYDNARSALFQQCWNVCTVSFG
jgi:hypothetical protein